MTDSTSGLTVPVRSVLYFVIGAVCGRRTAGASVPQRHSQSGAVVCERRRISVDRCGASGRPPLLPPDAASVCGVSGRHLTRRDGRSFHRRCVCVNYGRQRTGPYCVTFCWAGAARYTALIRVMFPVCCSPPIVVCLSVPVAPVLYVFLPCAVGGSPAVHALLLLCPLLDRLYPVLPGPRCPVSG